MDLKETLLKVTGITSPYIDELFAQLDNATADDKERIYKHIAWHIPTGGSRMVEGSNVLRKDEILKELKAYINGETVDTPEEPAEPEEDDQKKTPTEIQDEINAGGPVKLTTDLVAEAVVKPVANLDLNLNDKKVTAVAGSDFMDVTKGVEVTVKDGEIYEALGAKDNAESVFYLSGATKDKLTLENVKATGARIVYLNNANDEVLIKSGDYTVLYNSTPAVYVQNGGKAIIEGGRFQAEGGVANKYLLNLKDALLKDNPDAKATDFIEVRGGEFVNFDPSKSDSENPQVSFVAEGYTVETSQEGDNTIYKVVPVLGAKKAAKKQKSTIEVK